MGGQQRYERDLDRRMRRSVNAVLVRPEPIGLTAAELDLEHNPVIEADEPIKVRAWTRWHEATVITDAEAICWTSRAVRVRFTTVDGATHLVWVWASAVDRR